MKVLQILLIGLFLMIINPQMINAQKNYSQNADVAFKLQHYNEAIELYKKAYTKIKNNKSEKARVKFQIAECYRMMWNTKLMENWYKRVIKTNYPNSKIFLYYADALRSNQKYPEAIANYKIYLEKNPDSPLALKGIESCKINEEWIKKPSRFIVANARSLNSKNDDFSPGYGDKSHNVLFFTSTRDAATGKLIDGWRGQSFSDIFISGRDKKGVWSTPVPIEEPINSEANEGSTCMNSKMTEMYLTRCSQDKQKYGCKLFMARRSGMTFEEPIPLDIGGDTVSVGHPFLSPDDLELYFSSDMDGGQGGKDIWVARRSNVDELFSTAENLGDVINTPGEELFPSMPGEGVLYFASNYHLGLGGLDIFRAEKSGDTWGEPVNCRPPFNSTSDDYSIVFESSDEAKGFFTSNREEGRGGDDLYSFYLPPLIYTLQGIITNDTNKRPLPNVIVTIVGSDGGTYIDTTDAEGIYYFDQYQVAPKTTYEVTVYRKGFFTNISEVTTVDLVQSKGLIYDFEILPIPKTGIELPEILYDLAKWNLKPEYEKSLDGLIKTMKDNPTLIIELGSHTDFRDDDESNNELSQKRAQSVVDYLISRGIDNERLVAKGYGEQTPKLLKRDKVKDGIKFLKGTILTEKYIRSLKSDTHREAAHQLNRRTEFKVIGKDYVPKSKN